MTSFLNRKLISPRKPLPDMIDASPYFSRAFFDSVVSCVQAEGIPKRKAGATGGEKDRQLGHMALKGGSGAGLKGISLWNSN